MIEILQAESFEHIEEVRKLFREYEKQLELDLCFQGFKEELANLPGKYAKPAGRLFLAISNQKIAGCIALRKIDDEICEMKRLFVRNEFRGQKIGNLLIEKIISEARKIGYKKMRLDTYPPKMAKAVKLYESHGFYEIDSYYHNPHSESLYLELKL